MKLTPLAEGWCVDPSEFVERLKEHERMYAALLEIRQLLETKDGLYHWYTGDARKIWDIVCRGLGND